MYKKCNRNWQKVIFISLFLLIFYLPLKAEENESKTNSVMKEDSLPKTEAIVLSPTPLEKRFTINLDSFQLTEKGARPYKIRIDFSSKQIIINPKPHESLKKPKPPESSSSFLYTTSLITLTCLNIADYYTTVKALKYENLSEANPLMSPFTKNTILYTTVKLGLTAYNYYFLKSLYKRNKTVAWAVSVVANFVISYAVANNIKKIKEAQIN